MPQFLYHVTDWRYLPSILKYGLIPNRNRKTKHGDLAVWLTDSLENVKRYWILSTYSKKGRCSDPIVIKVNTEGLAIYRFLKHKDGYTEYYCLDNIEPDRIISHSELRSSV